MEVLNIGFIGLGVMGQPIVGRLLQAGYAVEVSDLSADAVATAVAAGATATSDSSPVGTGKDLVFISVTNAAITEQLVCDPGGLLDTGRVAFQQFSCVWVARFQKYIAC